MYLRSREDALDAVAEILNLPERCDQLVQATVKIMLCLEVEPRLFLADCQALLVEGGLEALRRKRHDLLESLENCPLVVLDPVEDRLFDQVAGALDALRFTELVRQIFPSLRYERWQIARALLVNEPGMKSYITRAIKNREDPNEVQACQGAVEEMVLALHQDWMDRAGALRGACLEALKGAPGLDPERVYPEGDVLFSIVATSDERALSMLTALDARPEEAIAQAARLYEMISTLRSLEGENSGPSPESGSSRQVA
jgi:hypothetical protein